MNTEWIAPQIVEITVEEAAELANIDLACAGNTQGNYDQDHM